MIGGQGGSSGGSGNGNAGQSAISEGEVGTCGSLIHGPSGIGKMQGTSHFNMSNIGSCGPCGHCVVGTIRSPKFILTLISQRKCKAISPRD